jgi:hypothetical protein
MNREKMLQRDRRKFHFISFSPVHIEMLLETRTGQIEQNEFSLDTSLEPLTLRNDRWPLIKQCTGTPAQSGIVHRGHRMMKQSEKEELKRRDK